MGLIGLLLLFVGEVKSQVLPSHPFRQYGIREGLPQSTVFSIIEDSLGYLWVGTENGGAARFDGRNFETFNVGNGLPSNTVFSMLTASDGKVWIGTNGGLCYFDGRKIINLSKRDGLPKFEVNTILEESPGQLLLGTSLGLFSYSISVQSENKLNLLVPDINVTCIEKFGSKKILGTDRGAFILNRNFTLDSTLYKALPDYWISSVAYKKGAIYIGIEYGVYEFKEPISDKFALIGDNTLNISGFCKDNSGNLWVAAHSGLYKMEAGGESVLVPKFSEYLNTAQLRTLFADRNGNLWVGTEAGLFKYLSDRFLYLNENHQLPYTYIRTIEEDKAGNIWLGTKQNGLIILDKNLRATHIGTQQGLPNDLVAELKADSLGNMWLATDAGLVQASFENGRFKTKAIYNGENAPEPPLINTVMVAGTTIWAAEFSGNIISVNNGKVKTYTVDLPISSKIVNNYSLERGVHGEIFLANNQGLFIEEKGHFKHIAAPQKMGIEAIQSLVVMGETLWILSEQGIYTAQYKGRILKNLSKIENLGGQSLSKLNIWGGKLLSDEIWFLHNRGISIYNPKTKQFRTFGYHEGFTLIETNQKALLQSTRNEIWVGTIQGVHIAPLSFVEYPALPPKISITRMLVNSEAVSQELKEAKYIKSLTLAPDFIELEYDHNDIQIQFEAVDFDASEVSGSLDTVNQVVYSHFLEGYDKNWSRPSPQAWGSWTNLAPGEYTLRVKARNLAGIWTPQPALIRFTILPPFWQTWWFYLLELLFLMSLLGSTLFFNRSGKQKRLTSILSVLTILVVFEILNVTLDPFLENFAGGVPIFRLLMNITLAGLLKPVETMMEKFLENRRDDEDDGPVDEAEQPLLHPM